MFTKLIGYSYFIQKGQNNEEISKVRCTFLDTERKADAGTLYVTLNFKLDNIPEITKEHINKECLVDVGYYNGSNYGKGLMFTGK